MVYNSTTKLNTLTLSSQLSAISITIKKHNTQYNNPQCYVVLVKGQREMVYKHITILNIMTLRIATFSIKT